VYEKLPEDDVHEDLRGVRQEASEAEARRPQVRQSAAGRSAAIPGAPGRFLAAALLRSARPARTTAPPTTAGADGPLAERQPDERQRDDGHQIEDARGPRGRNGRGRPPEPATGKTLDPTLI
jgi:hypothetical protein